MEKIQPIKPLLVLLYGFPGAGKTFFARQFCDAVQTAHLEQDKIRAELFETPKYSKQENYVVEHIMEYMTEEFLQARLSVVFDANVLKASDRKALRTLAANKGGETIVVWVQTDVDSAYLRSNKRDRRKTDDRYARSYSVEQYKELISKMQHPKDNEHVVVVSGKHTIASQISSVMKKLTDIQAVKHSDASSRMVKPALVNLVPNNQPRQVITDPVSGTPIIRRNIHLR